MTRLKNIINQNKILALSLLGYTILFIYRFDLGLKAIQKSGYYFKEMLQILPAVFVLTSLIQTWVPTRVIMKHFGNGSGLKGKLISLTIGSLSAGPIYAAFPVCKMLLRKGASISNIVIILGSWAVIKVPMLINEVKFMGPKYMAVRWVITTIVIFGMGYIMERTTAKSTIPMEEENKSLVPMVKRELCVGCGACVKACPDIFQIDENKEVVVVSKEDYQPYMESIEEVKEICPVMAIS